MSAVPCSRKATCHVLCLRAMSQELQPKLTIDLMTKLEAEDRGVVRKFGEIAFQIAFGKEELLFKRKRVV